MNNKKIKKLEDAITELTQQVQALNFTQTKIMEGILILTECNTTNHIIVEQVIKAMSIIDEELIQKNNNKQIHDHKISGEELMQQAIDAKINELIKRSPNNKGGGNSSDS